MRPIPLSPIAFPWDLWNSLRLGQQIKRREDRERTDFSTLRLRVPLFSSGSIACTSAVKSVGPLPS